MLLDAVIRPCAALARLQGEQDGDRGVHVSLARELAPFGLLAKTPEPGACLTTGFGSGTRHDAPLDERVPAPCPSWTKEATGAFMGQDVFSKESDIAETVWRAVHDTAGRLPFPAGPDAVRLARAK